MEDYTKLNKHKKQLEYVSKLLDLLADENDGELFEDLTQQESDKIMDFIEFMSDIELNIENKLKKVEEKIENEIRNKKTSRN